MLNWSRKEMKFQRGEEFGGWSRMSCTSKPPGDLLQQRGEDGQFQLGGMKLYHRTGWHPAQAQSNRKSRDKTSKISPRMVN